MKKLVLLLIIMIAFLSCNSDDDKASDILISVTNSQNWDGENVTASDFGITEFIDNLNDNVYYSMLVTSKNMFSNT